MGTIVYGDGLLDTEAGVSAKLLVQTRDRFGNNLTCSGDNCTAFVNLLMFDPNTGGYRSDIGTRVNPPTMGLYEVFYYPFNSGEVQMTVEVNEVLVMTKLLRIASVYS